MAVNQVVFDQVYKVLESVRSMIRDNYDNGRAPVDMRLFFKLNENGVAVRCDEDEWIDSEETDACIVSWDNTNEKLRRLARGIMSNLCD